MQKKIYGLFFHIKSTGKKVQRRSGQGMVEFALAIPIVLLMVWGIIEGGRLLFTYSTVAAASREAARYGAGVGLNNAADGVVQYKDCAGIIAAAERVGVFAGVDGTFGNVAVEYDTGPGTSRTDLCDAFGQLTLGTIGYPDNLSLGNRIVVTVNVPYEPIVPLVAIPSLLIQSVNAHTILMDVSIVGTPRNQVATLTPTPTNSPTPTHSPTPTETWPAGTTPTDTPTPTYTPSESPTPTNTPSPTPGGPCNSAHYTIRVNNSPAPDISISITNAFRDSHITRIEYYTWTPNNDNKNLQSITYTARGEIRLIGQRITILLIHTAALH